MNPILAILLAIVLPQPSPIAWGACTVSGASGSARCGTYEVYEDRAAGSGRRIRLHVIVLPAIGSDRRADPLLFLQGGPGDAPSFNVSYYAKVFADVHRTRDLVFVDVRGTGRSAPLTCPELGTPDASGVLDSHMLSVRAVKACRARLERQADLRLYTTAHAVDDLADVQQALGYPQVNLYGTSYGTRVAQVYMRRHPSHIRSVVMKGLVAGSMASPSSQARTGDEAWRALVARCGRETACARAYPGLARQFDEVLAGLDARPFVGDVPAAGDRPALRLEVTRGLFAEALRTRLYAPESMAGVPALVRRLAGGDRGALAETALGWRLALAGDRLAAGFFLSVSCAEDVPYLPADWTPLVAGTFGGDYRLREQTEACKVWPRGAVPPDHRQPLRSEIPTLLLSGELDPVTTPAEAEEVLRGLSRGRHVVLRHNGHPIGNATACTGRLVSDFVERASARDLDVSCAESVPHVPFSIAIP
jgi:pimeloyl-ACP methyl ester carboxylesterase